MIYVLTSKLFQLSYEKPLVNPVLLSVLILGGLLLYTNTTYNQYFEDTHLLTFLLGPATVALAVPLADYWTKLRTGLVPILVTVVIGAFLGILTVTLPALALELNRELVLSLMPKGVTTPIAIGVSEQIGGIPSLTAVFVILTGIVGAVLGTGLLSAVRVTDKVARGLALGIASHGIATARAYQEDYETGTFSSLAMGLNGAITAGLVPLLVSLLHHFQN